MTQGKGEHVPTYRDEDGGGPDEKGPMTRKEKLQAWWTHGEFEHPKTLGVVCALGVVLLVMPFTWSSAEFITGILTLFAGLCLVAFSGLIFCTSDPREKRGARKVMLISGLAFVICFPLYKTASPYAAEAKAAAKAQKEAEDAEELDRKCSEHLSVATPAPQASCPTADGTC